MTETTSQKPGCLGCLGVLVVFTIIGAAIWGGGIHMRVGQLEYAVGKPVNENRIVDRYLYNFSSKAEVADKAVKDIHAQLDQGDCQKTYEMFTESLKKSLTQSSFVDFCKNVHNKFGAIVSANLADWWIQPGNQDEKIILLRYMITFTSETLLEEFTWSVTDDKPKLAAYNIFQLPKVE